MIGPETNGKMDLKGHYPPNTNSHCIILNCVQITLNYFQCRISAILLVRADLFFAIIKTETCMLTLPLTDRSKAVVMLWFSVACFWCQSFGDVSPYVYFIWYTRYYFSSVWVAEWPPFEK